jgi:KR domain
MFTQHTDMACILAVVMQASAVGKVVVSAAQLQRTGACGVTVTRPGRLLVTGGTGALGLLVSAWLVGSHAVSHITLLSRSGHLANANLQTGTGQRQLAQLIQSVASVSVRSADAAVAEDCWDALMRPGLPGTGAVVGIVHAAGVLEDGILSNQHLRGLRRCVCSVRNVA